jgi:hypothetical protein
MSAKGMTPAEAKSRQRVPNRILQHIAQKQGQSGVRLHTKTSEKKAEQLERAYPGTSTLVARRCSTGIPAAR